MGQAPPAAMALQGVANARLLLHQLDYPGALNAKPIARQAWEVALKQVDLISSRDNGPGIDTGDILCEGFLCRAALLPARTNEPWDWLASELSWQEPGLRAVLDQPASGRRSTIEVPAEGLCWFGDLSGLKTPGSLPDQPRAVLAGVSLLLVGSAYGPGGIGALLQAELGEAITVAIKPNRVQVIGPGDTLAVLVDRYGTTVEALRQVNPELQDLKTIATAKGDSLYRLAVSYGTSTGALRQDNPALMQSLPYLVADGDTLANLAGCQQETVSALRLFNPQLARYPASAPLPAGVTIQLPVIGVADPLAVGLPLLVPQVEPGDLLPVGSWVMLPPRGVGGLAEL
ncbi:MAG: LysM peptidoglycan-binding domain-containing protein [Cyanobacteria bacterium]|nr:LysM peptidoglycan-binding domain-containing protein [Cyanobacteriota bacterium]